MIARDGSGGAVYLETSDFRSANCNFLNNRAVLNGSAVPANSSSVQIASNFSSWDSLVESSSLVKGNTADSDKDDTGDGGGGYVYDSVLDLSHTILYGNSAFQGGGLF
jgi:hypothetical protein